MSKHSAGTKTSKHAAGARPRHAHNLRFRARGRKRPKGILRTLALALLLAGFAWAAVAVGSGQWQVRPVLSGSMRPGFPVGGVVVTERVPLSSLRVGDVAVFHPPGSSSVTYVHRIISLKASRGGVVVRTKGDANLYPDPWALELHGKWAYQARFALPLLGYPAVWVHSPQGKTILVLVAGTLLVSCGALVVVDLRRKRAAKEALAKGPATSGAGGV
jgi:signal peptidase I